MSPTKDSGLSLYKQAKVVGSNPARATNFPLLDQHLNLSPFILYKKPGLKNLLSP